MNIGLRKKETIISLEKGTCTDRAIKYFRSKNDFDDWDIIYK